MANPSNICLDLSLSSDAGAPRQGHIWRLSFSSSNGPLTVEDSVMRDAATATVVARNLITPKDNRILSQRSDELTVRESQALSVQCANSVSNMGQRLLVRTRQVESLTAEVLVLNQVIRQLKYENRELHVLANNYSTSMKMKLDQLLDSEGRILSDNQRFVDVFQRDLLPSSSEVRLGIEAPNNPSPMPPSSRVPPSTKASSTEASHKSPSIKVSSTEASHKSPSTKASSTEASHK
ncbi:hypothetical protein TB1_024239 [Malus domestica]